MVVNCVTSHLMVIACESSLAIARERRRIVVQMDDDDRKILPDTVEFVEPSGFSRTPFFAYAVGVPALRSCATAVTSCAGANGLVSKILFGTPLEAHSSALSPVM
jgi:hypothetical protein